MKKTRRLKRRKKIHVLGKIRREHVGAILAVHEELPDVHEFPEPEKVGAAPAAAQEKLGFWKQFAKFWK